MPGGAKCGKMLTMPSGVRVWVPAHIVLAVDATVLCDVTLVLCDVTSETNVKGGDFIPDSEIVTGSESDLCLDCMLVPGIEEFDVIVASSVVDLAFAITPVEALGILFDVIDKCDVIAVFEEVWLPGVAWYSMW